MRTRPLKGFTLIEMVVVVAILLVLISLLGWGARDFGGVSQTLPR